MAAQTKQFDRVLFEEAPVPKAVRHFVVPALLSTLITIIYNMADTFFVGMIGDANQVAGLTVAFPYYQYLQAFANLWGVGANSVISRLLGRDEYKKVEKASSFGFWGGFLFMCAIAGVFAAVKRPFLYAAGASAYTYAYAASYFMWTIVIGGLPTLLSIVMCNLLRSEGHAKQGSFGLMLGGVLNLVLDPVFVLALHMNVTGAAVATCISNCISLIYFLIVYAKIRGESYLSLRPFNGWDGKMMGDVVLSGLPSCFLTVLGATGCIVQTSLYAKHSDAAVAAWGVVNRMSFICVNSTHGVSQGVLPLVGYNYSAKNHARARAVNKHAFVLLIAISVVILAFCEIFAGGIIKVFINDAATIEVGRTIMRLYMLCSPFMSVVLLVSTLCQAVGKWQYSVIMLTVRQLAFNIPGMLILEHFFAVGGVAISQFVTDFLNLWIALVVYITIFHKKVRTEEESSRKMRKRDPADS